MEAYLVDDRRAVRESVRYERNHLTLLAASDEGFHNLVRLSSTSFLDGFARGKANVDMELLERHSAGVIALSGCLQSRFCRRWSRSAPTTPRPRRRPAAGFGPEQVYFELQNNGIPEQDKANQGIARIAKEIGRPLVATATSTTCAARTTTTTRRYSACRPSRPSRRRTQLRHQRVLPQEPGGDDRVLLSLAGGGADDPGDRRALRVELELGGLLLPRYPTPEGEDRRRCCGG